MWRRYRHYKLAGQLLLLVKPSSTVECRVLGHVFQTGMRSRSRLLSSSDHAYKPSNDAPCLNPRSASLPSRSSISPHCGQSHSQSTRGCHSFHHWSLVVAFAMVIWSSTFVAATAIAVSQTVFALPSALEERQGDPCAAIAGQTYVVPSQVMSCLRFVLLHSDQTGQ